MVKIALLGIVTVLISLQLKEKKENFALLICLAGGLLILSFGISKLKIILRFIGQIEDYLSINKTYLGILLKIIGITYISEFASDLCRDCGQQSIGTHIELAGKLSIMAVSMPILLALIDTIQLM